MEKEYPNILFAKDGEIFNLNGLKTVAIGGAYSMLGGIATLGVVVLLSQGMTEFGFNAIFTAVVKELYKKGENKKTILRKIEKYPVSKSLKRKLREELESIS